MRKSVWLLLFGTFLAFYFASAGGRLYINDSYVKLGTARSFVDHGRLDIPGQSALTARSPKDGLEYSKFGVLHSILFLPATTAGKALTETGIVPMEMRGPVDTALASAGGPIFTALTVLLFFLWAREVGGDEKRALAAAILLGTATMIWPYSKRGWSEIPQMALLTGAAFALALARSRGGYRKIFLAGLLLGASVSLRITGALLLPIFAIPLLPPFRRGGGAAVRSVAILAAGALLWIIPFVFGYNWIRFGDPVSLYRWRAGGFTTPFLTGLYGLVASPGESLFLYSPILAAGAVLLFRLRKSRGDLFVIALLVPAAFIILYAPWWFHAYTWGPRFLLPAIPFLALPLLFFRIRGGRLRRTLLVLLVIFSVAMQFLGTAVHLGDLPELEKPLVRHQLLPPDRQLTRRDTWFHPLRTRPVSHLLVLGESAGLIDGRRGPIEPDLWPFTLRSMLGVPLRVTLPIEIVLLLITACGFVLLFRRLRRDE